MKFKHSKTPWSVKPIDPIESKGITYHAYDAELVDADGELIVDGVYEIGDAHLMSAAPDLYEELQELVNLIRAIQSSEYRALPDTLSTQDAEDALRRARGEK